MDDPRARQGEGDDADEIMVARHFVGDSRRPRTPRLKSVGVSFPEVSKATGGHLGQRLRITRAAGEGRLRGNRIAEQI